MEAIWVREEEEEGYHYTDENKNSCPSGTGVRHGIYVGGL